MGFKETKKLLILDGLVALLVSALFLGGVGAWLYGNLRNSKFEEGKAKIELDDGRTIETQTEKEKEKVLNENRGKIKTVRFQLATGGPDWQAIINSSFFLYLLLSCVAVFAERKRILKWFKPSQKFIFLGLGSGIAAFLLATSAEKLLSLFGLKDTSAWGFQGLGHMDQGLFFLLAALVAPIAEEVYFRGRLMGAMETDFGKNWALWISALLFAILHLPVFTLPIYVFMGWILGSLKQRTGSLVPSIVCHAVNNALAVGVLFLS